METKQAESKLSAQSALSDREDSVASTSGKERMNGTSANAPTDAEGGDLKWEVEVHMENFRFFLDLGLKAVVLFYAIVGGVLSVYFAKNSDKNNEILKLLLWIPFIISIVLGIGFLIGARMMKNATSDLTDLCRKAQMKKIPDFPLLTWLFIVFGALFFVTGAALVWLHYRLV